MSIYSITCNIKSHTLLHDYYAHLQIKLLFISYQTSNTMLCHLTNIQNTYMKLNSFFLIAILNFKALAKRHAIWTCAFKKISTSLLISSFCNCFCASSLRITVLIKDYAKLNNVITMLFAPLEFLQHFFEACLPSTLYW